jgi:hypothetical protein
MVLSTMELDGLKARPGGTDESSPAIYRRVRDHMGPRPGGTPEYRCAINSKDSVSSKPIPCFFRKLTSSSWKLLPMMLHLILDIVTLTVNGP